MSFDELAAEMDESICNCVVRTLKKPEGASIKRD